MTDEVKAPQVGETMQSQCAANGCTESTAGCEYCEHHHMRLCGQLHHRLSQVEQSIQGEAETDSVKAEKAPSHSEVVIPSNVQLDADLGVTPEVAMKLLLVREALAHDDITEAWRWLYKIADASIESLTPWAKLEALASTSDVFESPDRGTIVRSEPESSSPPERQDVLTALCKGVAVCRSGIAGEPQTQVEIRFKELRDAQIVHQWLAGLSSSQSIERQDVCVLCKHPKFRSEETGYCRELLNWNDDTYCGCKCVFPSTSPAATGEICPHGTAIGSKCAICESADWAIAIRNSRRSPATAIAEDDAIRECVEKLYRAGCGHVMDAGELEAIIAPYITRAYRTPLPEAAANKAALEICDWCGIDQNDSERVAAIITKHLAAPLPEDDQESGETNEQGK